MYFNPLTPKDVIYTFLRVIHIVPFVISSVLASEDIFDNYRQGKEEILLNMPRWDRLDEFNWSFTQKTSELYVTKSEENLPFPPTATWRSSKSCFCRNFDKIAVRIPGTQILKYFYKWQEGLVFRAADDVIDCSASIWLDNGHKMALVAWKSVFFWWKFGNQRVKLESEFNGAILLRYLI